MQEVEVERDGRIHPCNGYMLVSPHEHPDIVVVRENTTFTSGVVVEMSDDDTDDIAETKMDDHEWRRGDLIFYKESIEVDGNTFVHWLDVVAYKRF